METFADGTLTLHVKESRELQTLRDFSPRVSRPELGRNLLRLSGASLLAEMILVHVGEEGNPDLFRTFVESLDSVAAAQPGRLPGAILSGGWRIMASLGFHPELSRCVECGQAFSEEDVGRFDFSAGGIRCAACVQDGKGPRVGPGAREELRGLIRGEPPTALRGGRAHLSLFANFVYAHLAVDRPLRTLPFLQAHMGHDDA